MPRYKPVHAGQAARKTDRQQAIHCRVLERGGRKALSMDMVSCRRQEKGEDAKSEIDLAAGRGILPLCCSVATRDTGKQKAHAGPTLLHCMVLTMSPSIRGVRS